jgi:hypothetical protein
MAQDRQLGPHRHFRRTICRAGSRPSPRLSAKPEHPPTAEPEPARHWVWLKTAKRFLTAGLLGVAAATAYQHRSEIADARATLAHLRTGWLIVAIAAEAASMIVFAQMQRRLLRAGGFGVQVLPMVGITLAGNAMSTSLPAGAAWSTSWAFGQFHDRGAKGGLAAWILLISGALSSYSIFVIVAVGSWVAGGHGPLTQLRGLAAFLFALPFVVAFVYMTAHRNRSLKEFVANLWTRVAGYSAIARQVATIVRQSVGDIQPIRLGTAGWIGSLGLATLNWLCDAFCAVGCMEALDVRVPWRAILAIYGLTQIAASLPITPGGLGVVEASMAALLISYGTRSALAVAVVALYRIVSFWGLVPIGWGAWLTLGLETRRRTRGRVRSRAYPQPLLAALPSSGVASLEAEGIPAPHRQIREEPSR